MCKLVKGILSLLTAAGAAAVVVITATKLQHWTLDSNAVRVSGTCWFSADPTSQPPCTYAYTVAGVSLAAALALSLLLCFTCNLCGCGTWVDAIVEGGTAAWWGVAAGVFARNAAAADGAGVEGSEWRQYVLYAAYGEVAAFGVMALLSVARGLAACCGRGGD